MEGAMENQQKQMGKILATASTGLNKAATDFQAAVREFAIFRGGITDEEVAETKADVGTAEQIRDSTQSQFTEQEMAEGRECSEYYAT